MPFEFGRKHGNGYLGNTTRKITFTPLGKETCDGELGKASRINCGIIRVRCPEACEFFEECLKKSPEVVE